MKIKRRKTCNRHLAFYKQNYGIHEPFQILVDVTFCHAALEYKVHLKDQLPKYLGAAVQLVTTKCILHEARMLGNLLQGALLIAETFQIRKCGHKKHKSARECIMDYVGESNPHGLFVASQDKGLWESLRPIPGVPLLHINHNAIVLEKPHQTSIDAAEQKHTAKVSLGAHEKETIEKLKAVFLPDSERKEKRKRKRPKEPNPLSVKRKKTDQKPNSTEEQTHNAKRKKKRRRKVKIPEHVLSELDKIESSHGS